MNVISQADIDRLAPLAQILATRINDGLGELMEKAQEDVRPVLPELEGPQVAMVAATGITALLLAQLRKAGFPQEALDQVGLQASVLEKMIRLPD